MYGLSSRASLSTKQSRWTRDVDQEIRSFPAQQAINSSLPEILPQTPSDELRRLKQTIIDLSEKYSSLETKYLELEHTVKSSLNSSSKQVLDLDHKLSLLFSSMSYTEQPLSKCDDDLGICLMNSSEFSTTDNEPGQHYTPIYISENYNDSRNVSVLDANLLKFTIYVNSAYGDDETAVIYPFGHTTDIPKYIDMTLELELSDIYDTVNGSAFGKLSRNSDGVYVITITDIYSDGESSEMESFVLPLRIMCHQELTLE